MPLVPNTRACLTCGTMLRGRTDKKFCDDYCRSAYNNQLQNNVQGASFVRKVNSRLRKNRRILEEVFADRDAGGVNRTRMVKKGFNFHYFTSLYTDEKGLIYFFCYEYGYRSADNEWYQVIKRVLLMK